MILNLSELNKEQLEAVKQTEGPLLILAGAGSGKTKIVTTKIAYLIKECKVYPGEILAFTFTNKAANEMKTRVASLLNMDVKNMWIGTFHSICVRILRRDLNSNVFTKNFTIYDTANQKTLIRECIRLLNLNTKIYTENYVLNRIGSLRNEGVSLEEFRKFAASVVDKNVLKIFEMYEKKKREYNALDFDDLISKTIELLENDEMVRSYYQERFRYVFVDEYQDTNEEQYRLIRLLSEKHNNISVVGDADQSIYKWRGANINNILNFSKDFKNSKQITMAQNYRSTNEILNSANYVIANNTQRIKKDLWADENNGDKPMLFVNDYSETEANNIAIEVLKQIDSGIKPSEIAILYRSNALSRALEESFIKNNIKYRIVGGLKFYDRAEIKDLIAYLRLISNTNDDLALIRIINSPKRGIGATTVDRLKDISESEGKAIFDIISDINNFSDVFNSGTIKKLNDFRNLISNLRYKAESLKISELLNFLISQVGYVNVLEAENTVESHSKIENIQEFVSVATNYDETNEESNLESFLSDISLLSDVDKADNDSESVSMLTIHSAKGLEYDVVYIIALEEGIFPTSHAETDDDIEEERRLMYVAITRAKKRLFLSYAHRRNSFGKVMDTMKSRFIDELGDTIDIDNRAHKNTVQFVSTSKNFFTGNTVIVETPKDNRNEADYKVGQKVLHKKWGRGIITAIVESNNDNRISILFDTHGLKNLLQSFAPLKVIDNE